VKPKLNEAIINKADVNAILKTAAEQRNDPGFKRFFGLGKEKVDVEDLRQAWAHGLDPDGSDGYSNDTADIKHILKKFGFGDTEINKVFGKVFKTDDSKYDDRRDAPRGMDAVQKTADFIIKNNLQKSVLLFLQQEFADEIGIRETAMYEEVRQIFTLIVQEERTNRAYLIKEEEKILLGRTRK